MPNNFNASTDLYRKIYVRLIYGDRINGVSPDAELAFIRLQLIADFWGNFPASLALIQETAFAKRTDWATTERIAQWLSELESPPAPAGEPCRPLISKYAGDGRTLYHIHDFVYWQPAARNGSRPRAYPASPWDESENKSASEGFPVNPSESQLLRVAQEQQQEQKQQQQPSGVGGGVAAAEFIQRRIDADTATWASGKFPPESIRAAFAAFDEKAAGQRIRNPAGLIRTLLKNGCTPPLPRQTRGYAQATNGSTKHIAAVLPPLPANADEGIAKGAAFLARGKTKTEAK